MSLVSHVDGKPVPKKDRKAFKQKEKKGIDQDQIIKDQLADQEDVAEKKEK